jgi:hypothetical protein
MKTTKEFLNESFLNRIAGVMILCSVSLFYGCGDSSDKAKHPVETNRGKADFASLVKETDRLLSGEVRSGKPGETKQGAVATEGTTSSTTDLDFESALVGHELYFYFPNRFEENNYLEILEKSICDAETITSRRKESEGLVSCVTWKASLRKSGTMLKMNISKYENEAKAWEAINRMRSKGGFIAGDVILAGDEEWPETPEGQIEARSFIKSYYGRIRPTYVYKNDMGKPEDFLLDNDRELEALQAGE